MKVCQECNSEDIALFKTRPDIFMDDITLFKDYICLRCGHKGHYEKYEGQPELTFKHTVVPTMEYHLLKQMYHSKDKELQELRAALWEKENKYK